MRLLLDTHAFLWWLSDWDHLADDAVAAIADPANEVFVSAVSGWEIGVDRMLVAQAQAEGLVLLTRDARISLYDVPTMRV